MANRLQDDQDPFFDMTVEHLARFGERSRIVRQTSLEASKQFENGTLDFVYIDARHDLPWIAEDLRVWWPKIRTGGVFAGHDYLDGDLEAGRFRVRSAVDEFAAEHRLAVWSTAEEWPSWITLRP